MHAGLSGRTSAHQNPIGTRRPLMNIIASESLTDATALQRRAIRERAALSQRRASAEATRAAHGRVSTEVRVRFGRAAHGRSRGECADGWAGGRADARGGRDNPAVDAIVAILVLLLLLLELPLHVHLCRILEREPRHLRGRVVHDVAADKVVRAGAHCAFLRKRRVVLVPLLLRLLRLLVMLVQAIRRCTGYTRARQRGCILAILLALLRLPRHGAIASISLSFGHQRPYGRLRPMLGVVVVRVPILRRRLDGFPHRGRTVHVGVFIVRNAFADGRLGRQCDGRGGGVVARSGGRSVGDGRSAGGVCAAEGGFGALDIRPRGLLAEAINESRQTNLLACGDERHSRRP